MRAVIQRVERAQVRVGDRVTGEIGLGLLVFVGVGLEDTAAAGQMLADKIANLRIFDDVHGRMNLSLLDLKGEALVVSEFTLYGDCRKGRRPNYVRAAKPERARPLYLGFVEALGQRGIGVAAGEFQAMMHVELVNDGPVTLLLDTERPFRETHGNR
jgi:D-aminoacyl-tRNA deacylase